MNGALFLDRDGTIIRDVGYPRDPAGVEPLAGVFAALTNARQLGYRLVIVSNQSGVARGLIQPSEARAVQARVVELFAREGVAFDGAYFCFHAPDDGCSCRKPKPGMLFQGMAELGIAPERSFMIGDKLSDVEAGIAAGVAAISFGAYRHPGTVTVAASWSELAAWLGDRALEKG